VAEERWIRTVRPVSADPTDIPIATTSGAPVAGGPVERWRSIRPYRLVVFTVALIAALRCVDQLMPIVVALLLTIGFGLMMDAPVRALGRARISRPLATTIVVLATVGAGIGAAFGLWPALRGQMEQLGHDNGPILTQLADRINDAADLFHLPGHVDGTRISHWLTQVDLTGAALNAGEGVILVVFSLMTAAWAVAAPDPLRARLLAFVPRRRREVTIAVTGAALDRLRRWIFGVSVLSLTMGVLTYVALLVLDVPFALLFALMAGLCESIPTFGVLIASAGPVALTLLQHPGRLPWLLIGIVVIHQLEDRLLQPLVMRRAVDIPPTLIGFAVLTFGAVLGVLGAIIALPVTAVAITVHDALTGADPTRLESTDPVELVAAETAAAVPVPGEPGPVAGGAAGAL
jgi:predicted PurR-regulated permease PerM